MSQIDTIISAAGDINLSSAQKSVFTLLVLNSDETGLVGADEAGRSLADGRVVAANLQIGESTAHKAFVGLERAGYIEWERVPTGERNRPGITGKIRIVLSPAS